MNKLGIRINAKLELICMYHKKIPDATYQATCQSVMQQYIDMWIDISFSEWHH
jgi:hypothetical protein